MRYTLLNIDTNRISYLLDRPIVDMHTPTDKERPIFLSKSKLVILELTEDEFSLLINNGFNPELEPVSEGHLSINPEDFFPEMVPNGSGGYIETFKDGSEAVLYAPTE